MNEMQKKIIAEKIDILEQEINRCLRSQAYFSDMIKSYKKELDDKILEEIKIREELSMIIGKSGEFIINKPWWKRIWNR